MKKRIRRSDPQKQTYWEGVVRRWKESGQSVRGFCRAEGLGESSFHYWQVKLERRSAPPGAASSSRPRASQVAPAPRSAKRRSAPRRGTASFLPIRVVEDGVAKAPHAVEIVLAQGRMVRVRAGFDRQTLADVLAVLEARPC
jgi:hypothetical protein